MKYFALLWPGKINTIIEMQENTANTEVKYRKSIESSFLNITRVYIVYSNPKVTNAYSKKCFEKAGDIKLNER